MMALLVSAAAGSLALQQAGAFASSAQPAAARAARISEAPLPAGEGYACPVPKPGYVQCQAVYMSGRSAVPARGARATLDAAPPYTPNDLRSAYKLTSASRTKGRHETIAIVDAFRDPDAAKDLTHYRQFFGLPACTEKSHCLRILNQNGRASHLPATNAGWAAEETLDLDMVSAICPHCHIVLVEAKNTLTSNMGAAERVAARHARFVSNSWSGAPERGDSHFNGDFNHKGDVIDFAAGDFGYGDASHRFPWGVAYPTELPFVTAVGGTSLVNSASRGRSWTETVWGTRTDSEGGTNSGCTTEARPSWQRRVTRKLRNCRGRIENDVSANANPETGVAIYDTFTPASPGLPRGWQQWGGTSEATPIITGIYALAGVPARGTYPSSYPYKHVKDFYDVRIGTNGSCAKKVKYLCHAERGYDGPTGLGTPIGVGGLRK
jgi:subtilase family serine protease